MDKTKVLILGTGHRSRLLMDLLDGYKNLFEVEMRELPKIPDGKEPDILVYDEVSTLDFSKLEEMMYAKPILVGDIGILHHPPIGLAHYLRDVYNPKQIPADHPSRKREPKGPRNKWGKIK